MLFSIESVSQAKEINQQEQLWLGYFNQTRLTQRSGVWLDLHFRSSENFVQQKVLSVFRMGYMYHFANARVTAGYAKFTRFATEGSNQIEHRGWQQLEWNDTRSRLTLTHRIRLEERFFMLPIQENQSDRFSFNYRGRYSLSMSFPIIPTKNNGFATLIVSNEVLLNFGKQISNNYFDQNRIFGGIAYPIAPNTTAQIGYMFVFQQLPAVNQFMHINSIRLFLFHTLNLSEKRKPQK